jgi:glycosidase
MDPPGSTDRAYVWIADAIGGLHLLPVYPSSGDGGFAPLTYKEIDPEMGTWDDIERFSKKYELMLECM